MSEVPPPIACRPILPTPRQAALAFSIAAALLLTIDLFFLESATIPSASMEPTLLARDHVLVRKFPRPRCERFDVISLQTPHSNGRLTKRIVGLPGERIRIEDGWRVFINDEPLAYADTPDPLFKREADHHLIRVKPPDSRPVTPFAVTLAADEYFVLGDNRLDSADSRVIGPVRRREIDGTLLRIWYGFDRQASRPRLDRVGLPIR